MIFSKCVFHLKLLEKVTPRKQKEETWFKTKESLPDKILWVEMGDNWILFLVTKSSDEV